MTVLIVDDTNIMRMILKDTLRKYCEIDRHGLHEAADGREAVAKYKAVKPDLVFLDIEMPDMDGIEAVKELKKVDPEVKIIMCTSSTDQADVLECISAGAKDYIIKPPRPERVVKAVKTVMNIPDTDTDADSDPKPVVRELSEDADVSGEVVYVEAQEDEMTVLKREVSTLKEEVAAIKAILEKANIS